MAGRLVLVTGFPGFIARRLAAKLVGEDQELEIAALVEPRFAEQAREVAAALARGRIEVLPGDIAKGDLGLDEATRERLSSEATQAYHLAAVYDLAVPYELAHSVNVDGTGNVLELCAGCERLERLNYMSTAYVAGERTGVVYEHELVMGQGFKNHYEATKFQAEVWVRARMDRLPTTIYRPAIVVGDSRSGETQKFDGPYYMLRTISRSERDGRRILQFGASGAYFNVVPVDFVVDVLVAAGSDELAVGETLHLVDPDPVTAARVLEMLAREYAGRAPSLRLPASLIENALRVRAVRDAFAGAPRESIRYLNHRVRFDTRRASELLARHGLSCPPFERYVGAIVDFFREHEDDPAYSPRPL